MKTLANPQMESVVFGVPISFVGEDGDLIALGHIDPTLMLAAVRTHSQDLAGLDDRDLGLDGLSVEEMLGLTTHGYAIFQEPTEENSDYAWFAHRAKSEDDGAIPVTRWGW